ncbi:MAG: hypothetical protein HYX21_00710 [Candidatus Yanofskybacteria bacterium]|nr:hypothetical protein [Candidatus Yanofskybacteria bacterium]
MALEHFFGTLTLVFGILLVTVGLTAQVVKNYREKRCGNPILLLILVAFANMSRIGYAVTLGSWYLLIPDVLGSILLVINLYQFFCYRKTKITD